MFEIIIVYFTTIINQKIQMSLTRLVKSSFKELAGNGLNNEPICPAYKGHLVTTKKLSISVPDKKMHAIQRNLVFRCL